MGEYAVNFVKGFQQNPDDPGHLQASACCKHYIGNQMENSNENGHHDYRNHFNAIITQQDLVLRKNAKSLCQFWDFLPIFPGLALDFFFCFFFQF